LIFLELTKAEEVAKDVEELLKHDLMRSEAKLENVMFTPSK